MPSLKDFVEALGTTWPVALAALLGSTAVLTANAYDIAYAAGLADWILTMLFVVAVFAAGVCISKLIQTAIHGLTWVAKWRRTAKYRGRQIKWLNNLPHTEHILMSHLFTANRQAFAYTYGESRFVGLVQKGLVVVRDGQYSLLDWPHIIPDHIWEEMTRNPEKFYYDEGRGNPLKRGF